MPRSREDLGKTAGEMYAALHLSPGPLSLEEVVQSLNVTKGNISVAIRQLKPREPGLKAPVLVLGEGAQGTGGEFWGKQAVPSGTL